jgi:hypothetical protein
MNIIFKEWLPDLPDLDNPGLTEAKNVVPTDTTYKPFYTGSGLDAHTLNGVSKGAYFRFQGYGSNSISYQSFEGTATKLYITGSDKSGATYSATANGWQFADYEEIVFATNGSDYLQQATAGATAFASVTDAPKSNCIGIIGQFIVLGDLQTADRYAIQWSGIDNPLSWPTPSSTTAIAQQSGRQEFTHEYGYVSGISGGDQFGLIFQEKGISRATYVGGTSVFQFDDLKTGVGCA